MNGTLPPATTSPARPPLRIAVLGADPAACQDLANALAQDAADSTPSRPLCIDADAPLQRWAHVQAAAGGIDDRSEAVRADGGLAIASAQHRAAFHATLLIGTDGAEPDAADRLLRHALTHAGVPFQVLYGTGAARALQARKALQPHWARRSPATATPPAAAQNASPAAAGAPAMRLRAWGCEKCSDPECEHQLFQRLLASR